MQILHNKLINRVHKLMALRKLYNRFSSCEFLQIAFSIYCPWLVNPWHGNSAQMWNRFRLCCLEENQFIEEVHHFWECVCDCFFFTIFPIIYNRDDRMSPFVFFAPAAQHNGKLTKISVKLCIDRKTIARTKVMKSTNFTSAHAHPKTHFVLFSQRISRK